MRTHKNLMGIAAAMVLGSGYNVGLNAAVETYTSQQVGNA